MANRNALYTVKITSLRGETLNLKFSNRKAAWKTYCNYRFKDNVESVEFDDIGFKLFGTPEAAEADADWFLSR